MYLHCVNAARAVIRQQLLVVVQGFDFQFVRLTPVASTILMVGLVTRKSCIH